MVPVSHVAVVTDFSGLKQSIATSIAARTLPAHRIAYTSTFRARGTWCPRLFVTTAVTRVIHRSISVIAPLGRVKCSVSAGIGGFTSMTSK